MTPSSDRRPSRDQLQRRLGFLKRATVVLAAGLFAAVATLAAGRATAHGQGSNGTTTNRTQTNRPQDQAPSGSFWFNPDDGGGSLGDGSNAAPPAGGTHAS